MAGEVHLGPQSVVEWSSSLGAPDYGMRSSSELQPPYTVNWYCENGSPFSSCSLVSEGTLVYANLCPGALECQPNPQKNK